MFLFTQNYDQDAVNTFAPFVLSPFIAFPVDQHSPQAALDDIGVGVYGQGTVDVRQPLDLTVGARVDHENEGATCSTFFDAGDCAAGDRRRREGFSNVSPQFAFGYHASAATTMAYVSVTGGFKAGGFNPASPAGSEAYGEEHTWNFEGGVKTRGPAAA